MVGINGLSIDEAFSDLRNHYSPPRGSFVTHALNRTDVPEVNVETPAGMVGTATLQPPRAPDGGVPVRPYADLQKTRYFVFRKVIR